jgi:hypothetical protein
MTENAKTSESKSSKQSTPATRSHPRSAAPGGLYLSDDAVLTLDMWARLNGFSPRTGRRILKSGTGPKVLQLSTQRRGITVKENRRWQESRTRPSGTSA